MRFRFETFRCEILHAQEHVISVAGTWDGGWFRYRVGKAREAPAPPRRVAYIARRARCLAFGPGMWRCEGTDLAPTYRNDTEARWLDNQRMSRERPGAVMTKAVPRRVTLRAPAPSPASDHVGVPETDAAVRSVTSPEGNDGA